MNEREYLLEELKEHTQDCDCARSQHYYEEKQCRRYARRFNFAQSVVFLATITFYVLIVSGLGENSFITVVSVVLTVASTLLEIMSYMLSYEEDAMAHWKSAQMYSELYRKCQFFVSDYANASMDVWREKLKDIAEELSRISSFSPALSDASYNEWAKYGYSKEYPVHKALFDCRYDSIEQVTNSIVKKFYGKDIEIYLFGSFLSSMHHNDVDIAVILHDEISTMEMKKELNRIESEYAIKGLVFDITLITDKDIVANRCTQFIKNIIDGKCVYKTPGIKKCLKDYELSLSNYSEMVSYFYNIVKNESKDIGSIAQNGFFAYYHALTSLLDHYNIRWYGELSLIQECELLSNDVERLSQVGVDPDEFKNLLINARLFMDKKNIAYTLRTSEDEVEDINEYKKIIEGDILLLKNIASIKKV